MKGILSLTVALPMLYSCEDTSEIWQDQIDDIWESIDSLESRVDSLEQSLNAEISALNKLISGVGITISECVRQDDGSYLVKLSDNTSFTIYPEAEELKSLVTYIEIDGVKYWATYDADGKSILLRDENDNPIPVVPEEVIIPEQIIPTVEERDGIYYIIIGENEYVTGYKVEEEVTIFTDYKLNTDDAGEIVSVTFTFGEGMTFTVSVASYQGLRFIMYDADSTAVNISDYFIAPGTTERIHMELDGVSDYVAVTPDGWKYEEFIDEEKSIYALDITAPSRENITSGAAAANGQVKVFSVLENGKSAISKLNISADAFKSVRVSTSSAIVNIYNGVEEYVYGICLLSEFNADSVLTKVNSLAEATSYPAGMGVSSADLNKDVEEILGSELSRVDKYAFWAIPTLYDTETQKSYYDINTLKKVEFGYASVVLGEPTFNEDSTDVTITLAAEGITAYYGGTAEKTDKLFEEILKTVNEGKAKEYKEPMTYEGSVFDFPEAMTEEDFTPVAGATYITWILPKFDDAAYTADDIIYQEYTFPKEEIIMSEPAFNEDSTDVSIDITLKKVAAYYGGTDVKTDNLFTDILASAKTGEGIEEFTEPMTYSGSAFGFPNEIANEDVVPTPGQTYITWVLAKDRNAEYAEADIYYKEFTLPEEKQPTDTICEALPVLGEATITRVSISVPVTVSGAVNIMYAFLTTKKANRYTTPESKKQYVIDVGKTLTDSVGTAKEDGLSPESEMTLFALAVDEYGNYGEVVSAEYVTKELIYNNLTVTVQTNNVTSSSAEITVSVSGGDPTGYAYWIGPTTDSFWTSIQYLGGSTAKAQQYIALYPTNGKITQAMKNYPIEDGKISLTDLTVETKYAVIILAKDASGEYSKAGSAYFETISMDLGTVYKQGSTKWEEAKAATTIDWIEGSFVGSSGMGNSFGRYALDFSSTKTDLTALVLLGSTGYFQPGTTIEKMIVEIIGYTDKLREVGTNALDENGMDIKDTIRGGVVQIYDYYTHGYPYGGYAVFFTENDHNPETCERCLQSKEKIANKLDLQYYLDLVKEGHYWCETEEEARAAYDFYSGTPAFYNHYKDLTPHVYHNEGTPFRMTMPTGVGDTDYDRVYVVYRELDTDGTYNYYEPIVYELPEGCFDVEE